MTALAARGLSVVRGAREVVRDVSIELDEGRALAVLGPSGAGKSSLLGALAGEVPARGEVRLGGERVDGLALHERARLGLAYVPQGPSVLWDLRVDENLATLASLRGVALDVGRALARVGLEGVANQRARELSGGERRRLEVARALAMAPKVLLLDEPFSGLGPADIARLSTTLAGEKARGVSLVISDHHAAAALELADRAALLVDGAMAFEGAPEELTTDAIARGRYLG